MNLLRRIAALPGLRRFALNPAVRKFLATILAQRFLVAAFSTTTPARVIAGELFRSGKQARYVIRSTGVSVVMQHGRDLEALYELFHRGDYEPPEPLAGRLDRPGLRILDLGGNVGMFTAWASGRFPGCEITAFEPAQENVPLFREMLRANGSKVPARLIEACALPDDGEVSFSDARGAGSHQVVGGNGPKYPGIDVLPYLAQADFAKIDIEGGEWALLADPRFSQLSTLTLVMEYHRHLAPELPALQAAEQLLRVAGFECGFVEPNYWGHGLLWAWKGDDPSPIP